MRSNTVTISFVGLIGVSLVAVNGLQQKPNIVFVIADDVGWSDFGFNHPSSPIPTPFIDELASKGIQMKQYYTHAVCTPARASLMTGRYHVNTGLTYVLTPGTLSGLPHDIPTMPMLLKDHAGYATAMSGKWHLGHAQHSMTPVGRGFESFTGNYMWDTDSWTKEMYSIKPWEGPLMVDWVTEFDNGTYIHYAEPRHSTEAITRGAQSVVVSHAAKVHSAVLSDTEEAQPLFLYVAYTAAHSPLQPMPGHIEKCAHVPHLWRRQFCGMVVGMDEGVRNLTQTIVEHLGENTIMVVTSDNGGSPWFGGMNVPLRGIKTTPLEGGTRVPAIVIDFTADQRHIGTGLSATAVDALKDGRQQQQGRKAGENRYFYGLSHVSDWVPTLLSFGGVSAEDISKMSGLDGYDLSESLRNVPYSAPVTGDTAAVAGTPKYKPPSSSVDASTYLAFASPRSEVLYEMYYSGEFMFDQTVESLRIGDYKLVEGIIKDTNYYSESKVDHIQHTNSNFVCYISECLIRLLELYWGEGPFDTFRISLTHMLLGETMTNAQKKGKESTTRLYNVISDPTETTNLVDEPYAVDVIDRIRVRLAEIKAARPTKAQEVWVHLNRHEYRKTHISGDCSDNKGVAKGQCRFTHSWVEQDNDGSVLHVPERVYAPEDKERHGWTSAEWKEKAKSVHVLEYVRETFRECFRYVAVAVWFVAMVLIVGLYYCCGWKFKRSVNLSMGQTKRYVPLTTSSKSGAAKKSE